MAREDGKVGGNIDQLSPAEAKGALAWWLEAGVDSVIDEQPRNWLKTGPSAPLQTPPPNLAEPSQQTLAELRQWLSSSAQVPLASATARRILPHGPEHAP